MKGISKVMRFGAYSEDVQQRLRWMRDVLCRSPSAALEHSGAGVLTAAMMAQGILMGDEFHQRNITSSALLMRTLARNCPSGAHDKAADCWGDGFLSVTDQFFLP